MAQAELIYRIYTFTILKLCEITSSLHYIITIIPGYALHFHQIIVPDLPTVFHKYFFKMLLDLIYPSIII